MTILNNGNWDEVSVKLNNHETLLLLQSLKSTIRQEQSILSGIKEALSSRPDMTDVARMLEDRLAAANDKVKLHNELLPCFRSDYEHLKLEPIKLD